MNDTVRARAVELLGEASPVSKQAKKETVMSIRTGNAYMALKLVSPYDKQAQTYLDPVPRITFIVDGKYVRLPFDSGILKDLGNFMVSVGEAITGVEIPRDKPDMERIGALMQQFRNA